MIAIPFDFVERVIAKFDKDVKSQIENGKSKLEALKKTQIQKSTLNKDEVIYIDNLIKKLAKIVIAKPSELKGYEAEFPLPNQTNEDRKIIFKDKILGAMGYTGLRSSFYPKYFQKIGIKACVYCNSQLTIVAEKEPTLKKIAKFQVDHFIPEAEYPCFSISLFNLYPVCASCNNIKRDNKIDFKLYLELKDISASPFLFQLDDNSISEYYLSRNPEDLVINFSYPGPETGYEDFEETFAIKGIYNTLKDLAEEMILKAEIYNPSYKQILIDSFPDIFNNINLSNRLFIGNYVDKDDIHKRPLAKFTQDIAKQLKLIK
jgi:hypothetical protein